MAGEFAFIRNLLAPLATDETALNLQDDAAGYTPPPGQTLVLTTDALVDGVHVPEQAPPDMVAARLLAANLSDLTAKAASPVGCLLTLAVPPHWDMDWLGQFTAALGRGLHANAMPLWGGDTVRASQGMVSLTALGLVPEGQMLTRSGAQIGDDVYLSGPIGDGYLGLQDVLAGRDGTARAAYEAPQPPVHLAPALRGQAHAGIDISDGLLADLDHLCVASQCTIDLPLADVPLSAAGHDYLASGGDVMDLLTGGDDYQLAVTAPTGLAAAMAKLGLIRVGRVQAPDAGQYRAILRDGNGQEMTSERRGFSHF